MGGNVGPRFYECFRIQRGRAGNVVRAECPLIEVPKVHCVLLNCRG